MKRTRQFITVAIMTAVLCASFFSFAEIQDRELSLTETERQWLDLKKGHPLKLGLDPYSGMDYFKHKGKTKGYVVELTKLIEDKLDLKVEIVGDKSWGEVYRGLEQGEVDILFGANVTPQRLEWMAFTSPVHKYPYAVFARKDSSIQTVGDLDEHRLGVISGDVIERYLPDEYPNIRFEIIEFSSQIEAIQGLLSGEIEGFITSGGGVVHEFLFKYPQLRNIASIESVTSDLTLSTRKEDAVLAGILDKVIKVYEDDEIASYIRKAQIEYNRKILNLSSEELAWLEEDGRAVVGIADDYLPFDYYDDGAYRGITGELLKSLSNIIGVEFEVKSGTFASLYEKAVEGQVDVMNIAKTEDRTAYFYYPRPFSTERDIIVGKKNSDRVQDVYGLNGKVVAVVDGYWHEEFLTKNLKDVEILKTDDLIESLQLVRKGAADYMIENPTVIEYYVDGLGYTDIVKKGDTSKDSYLYLGVSKRNPELASIIDKALILIDYEDIKFKGIDSTPELKNEQTRRLSLIVGVLVIVLIFIVFILNRVFNDLIAEKANTQILKEKEVLMYTDALTNLSNRMHYNQLEPAFDDMPFPQCILIADLNNLKSFNDSYGHHFGDLLLKTFAKTLKAHCDSEYIFRMGGDEFMVVRVGCDVGTAQACIQLIESKCAEAQIPLENGDYEAPQAAFGYGVRLSANRPMEEVVIEADNNMYKHKAMLKGQS